MSSTHGVFQHRTGYYYTVLEEDFCEMYKSDGVNEVCRAYITSILETLTDKQYDPSGENKDIWVYMSLPEMARRMRNACSERTIHKELQGMIKDGYLAKRRAEGKATMEYCLNLKKIRDGLASLPEKQPCNSARYHLANLQDQSSNSATLTLQNYKNDLAELQPRISNRLNIEETKNTEDTYVDDRSRDIDASTPSENNNRSQLSPKTDELSTLVAQPSEQLPIAKTAPQAAVSIGVPIGKADSLFSDVPPAPEKAKQNGKGPQAETPPPKPKAKINPDEQAFKDAWDASEGITTPPTKGIWVAVKTLRGYGATVELVTEAVAIMRSEKYWQERGVTLEDAARNYGKYGSLAQQRQKRKASQTASPTPNKDVKIDRKWLHEHPV